MPSANLFLIDAHALCYRSFYAIKGLTASNGQPTNAVFGFVNTLRKVLADYQPEYVAVCFDSKGKTKREEKYAKYKIQRPSMPEDLISQIPIIHEAMAAYGLKVLEAPGYEADDIIATLTKAARAKNIGVVIVSDDKDMYQLADDGVRFLSPRENKMYETQALKKKLGFDPARMVDFIGLAGDSADNIPGVSGIGKVTATQLIERFGRLEDIFASLDNVEKKSVREKLESGRDIAQLSKELAVLEAETPIEFSLAGLKVSDLDKKQLFELFTKLEFRRFAQEFAEEPSTVAAPEAPVAGKKDIEQIIGCARKEKHIAVFVQPIPDETVGGRTYSGELFIAVGNDVCRIDGKDVGLFEEVLKATDVCKIIFDLKSSLKFLAPHGLLIAGPVFDCLIAGYLLGVPQSQSSVRDLAWHFLKKQAGDDGAQAVALLTELYPTMRKQLENSSLLSLLEDLEQPLSHVLFAMENEGVCLDVKLLKKMSKECEKKIDALSAKLYETAGGEFNLNSPKQLSHVLFEKLKLPVIKKTKTGFSTNEEVLTILAKSHEFPSLILEYRQLAKLKSTYIDALPKLVDPETNRLHAIFDQAGAETGRLSSRQPNLQNLPIRTELGRKIRKAIIASDKDHVLIAADYSQIELRILAHLSKDTNLLKAFQDGQDIHAYTASLIFDVERKDVDYHMRDTAKRVNFGIIYGMSAFGLAKDLGITQPEAQDFIDRYFLRYPAVKEFMDGAIAECQANGYVVTLLNRRRYLPEINSSNMAVRQYTERQAINTPVQGSAADLMKLAMIRIHDQLAQKKFTSKLIMTVHDELVFDVPRGEIKKMAGLVRETMENALELSVPVKVSVKAGDNWMEMDEI